MPNIVVIGASAGGVPALKQILRPLPADLQAAIFVVLHLSPLAPSQLPEVLDRAGSLRASAPVDGELIRPARVYVAPPDRHMLIEPGCIRLTRGPRENRFRPAIDPLFRTAARAYGSRVLGIVLTGLLDDGTAGLEILKSEGGLAVVQDPDEAMFDSMPRSALRAVPVDLVLPAAEIGKKLLELVQKPWKETMPGRSSVIAQEPPTVEGEKMTEDERILGRPSSGLVRIRRRGAVVGRPRPGRERGSGAQARE